MARREQNAQRAALAPAEDVRALAANRIEDGASILHPLLERRNTWRSIGKPSTTLIEADQPRKRRQPLDEAHPCRLLPFHREVRDPARDHQQVVRSLTDNLVGDVDLAVLDVEDRRRHPTSVARSPRQIKVARLVPIPQWDGDKTAVELSELPLSHSSPSRWSSSPRSMPGKVLAGLSASACGP